METLINASSLATHQDLSSSLMYLWTNTLPMSIWRKNWNRVHFLEKPYYFSAISFTVCSIQIQALHVWSMIDDKFSKLGEKRILYLYASQKAWSSRSTAILLVPTLLDLIKIFSMWWMLSRLVALFDWYPPLKRTDHFLNVYPRNSWIGSKIASVSMI